MMVKEKKEKESKLLNLILNYFLKFIYDLLKLYEIILYKNIFIYLIKNC